MNFKELIATLEDPARKGTGTKIVGSILVALSGSCLFLDKVLLFLEIEGSNKFGFYSYADFIWVLMTSLVPIALGMLFIIFRPYIISYLIPLYCYTIQITWTFQPSIPADDIYLHLYAIGSCVVAIVMIVGFNSIIRYTKREKRIQQEIRTEAKEIMELLKSKLASEI